MQRLWGGQEGEAADFWFLRTDWMKLENAIERRRRFVWMKQNAVAGKKLADFKKMKCFYYKFLDAFYNLIKQLSFEFCFV